MQVYTYSEARQKLAIVLEQAENTGKVLIRRKDGRTFALVPEKIASSPLNVPSIKANIDAFVKSQIQRICHFDHREKSYLFNRLRLKDFSFHSK